MAWQIERIDETNTSRDRDTVEAALVHLRRGDQTYRVTVELAGSAAAAHIWLDAYGTVRHYLEDDFQLMIGPPPTDAMGPWSIARCTVSFTRRRCWWRFRAHLSRPSVGPTRNVGSGIAADGFGHSRESSAQTGGNRPEIR